MKISLKVKLMSAFFILIALPMSILGAVSYKMASTSLQSSTKEHLIQQTSDTASLIDNAIQSVKSTVEICGLNGQLGKISQSENAAYIDDAFKYICDVQKSNEEFMEVLIVTDSIGTVIIDSESKEPDIDLSDRDYMKKAISTGDTTMSEVLTSRFTGNPAIFIACPIKENGNVVGTVVGSIKFDSISKYASKVKIGENGYGYMIDKNGLVVAHPDESKILKENVSESTESDFKSIVEKMKAGEKSDGFYTYDNVYKYVAFEPAGNWIVAVTADYDEYMASAISIRNDTLILVVLAIIIAMVCSYIYSTKGIINPIKELQKLMKLAGDGDLRVKARVGSKDEIGELQKSFNTMIKHQDEIVKSVRSASEHLNTASEEIASSLEEISATTEEISATVTNVAEESKNQNTSIVDVSEVLVQLSSLVQLAQNRAQSTNSNAINSKKIAHLGRGKVEETVRAMNSINIESNDTFNALKHVNELSVEVSGIVTTINAIAEQTNLLALNAAIEAARAGEHGKGFSIVAEEVRELSEETNNKAKEIAGLVSEMVKQIENAVKAMERANSEVENGVEVVSETDKAFLDIIDSIEDIAKHVGEILDITSDEVASSDKVISLINDIATITENNSKNCEGVSLAIQEEANVTNNLTATAEETSAMSEQLMGLVEKFIV